MVELEPISTVISSFLQIMKHRGYIKDFQVYDPHTVGRITVELQDRVKDCKALTYRQDIKAKDIESYRLCTLPKHQWGYVVITTPDGVLDHEEAAKRNVGGQRTEVFLLIPIILIFCIFSIPLNSWPLPHKYFFCKVSLPLKT